MLSWAGFIGRLVELVLTKVIAKRVDLALDERKMAAAAFLKLHAGLATLEAAGASFAEAVQPFLSGSASRLYRVPLSEIAARSDQASRELLEAIDALLPVVCIYDPTLGALLRGVAMTKAEIVSAAAATAAVSQMDFRLLPNPESVFMLSCSSPDNDLMTVDLEDSYNKAANVCPSQPGEWPTDILLTLVKNHRLEERLADGDHAGIAALQQRLKGHLSHLATARQHLETFIRDKFSIDDLLYVQKRVARQPNSRLQRPTLSGRR